MAYPMLILVVGSATIFFMFTFCLPRLSGLFNQSYESLPFVTKILMAFGQPEWQTFFWSTAAAIVGLVFFGFVGGGARKIRRQRLITRLPLLGTIKMKSDIARFCNTLGMLIQNGIPIYEAIEVTRPVLANDRLEGDLADAQKRIMGGEMLTTVLGDAKNFPPFVSHMVAVGEESGRVGESMEEVARFYTRESSRAIKVLTSLIEPIFILVLSIIVGVMVAGIMLPIFNMNWME